MKIMHFAAAALISVATLTSAYAADTTNNFDLTLRQTADGTLTKGFSDEIVDSGTFTDIFTFSPTVSTSSIVTQITAFNLTAKSGLSFTSVMLNGYDLFVSPTNPTISLTSGPITIDGPTQLVLTVKGISTGGGSYGGNINVASAVPEPATYGMMLGGIGLIGFMARRRKAGAVPALAA